jgi:hypothetical protein
VAVSATAVGKAKLAFRRDSLSPTVAIYAITTSLLVAPPEDWSALDPVAAIEVFARDDMIEAGETQTDAGMVSLGLRAAGVVGYRTEFTVVTNWPWHRQECSWRAVHIAGPL